MERLPTYHKKVAKFLVERVLERLVSRVEPHGLENLEKIRPFLEQRRPVFIMPNHLSYLDGPLFYKFFEEKGFSESVFVLRINLYRNPITRFFVKAVRHIPVWSESLPTRNEREETLKKRINFRALLSVRDVARVGVPIFIFPEGTRSRTKLLAGGEPKVSAFLEVYKSAVILPAAIWGTEEIMPPGSIARRRGPVAVNFGEPVEVSQLHWQYRHLNRESRADMFMRHIMNKIGELLPGRYLRKMIA